VKKKQLRQLYAAQRNNLSAQEYQVYNNLIASQLNNINWLAVKCVSLFLPIQNLNEVNTYPIIEFFKQHFPETVIVIPKTNFTDLSMQHIPYTQQTVLKKNKYHIMEPVCGNVVQPCAIDAVFVPLLVFDTLGYRVGYGKGIYDRFLACCRADVVKVGLSFFNPVNIIDDSDNFDIPLNYCITPHKIFCF
jgi:5-formyltetrahydrofolate cyclo-ligase